MSTLTCPVLLLLLLLLVLSPLSESMPPVEALCEVLDGLAVPDETSSLWLWVDLKLCEW